MPAKHCPACGTDWPTDAKYEPCPECHEKTSYFPNEQPIHAAEAQSRWNRARFRDYYEERGPREVYNDGSDKHRDTVERITANVDQILAQHREIDAQATVPHPAELE